MAPRRGRSTSTLCGMSIKRLCLIVACLAIIAAAYARVPADAQERSNLNCVAGPLKRDFGKTPCYVYACDDGRSVVIITAPGNPAMPFYFFFVWGPNGFDLRGEGTGNKELTDAAFASLKSLSEADVARLYRDAASIGGKT